MFDKHVLIATPSTGSARIESVLDGTALAAYAGAHVAGLMVEQNAACSSLLLQNRHNLVRAAQARHATHILWLDDDMAVPSDALARLLRHDKKIVGANYTTRKFPVLPLAVKEGRRVSSAGKSGLEEVTSAGLGLMLVDMEVFDRIEPPWFMLGWSKKADEYVGEDVWFCLAAKKAGYPVYVDHDLSLQVGHYGTVEFGFDMVEAT
jgi:hypothetical protein